MDIDVEPDKLAVIDWQECLRVTSNRPKTAADMLELFVGALPGFETQIGLAVDQHADQELSDHLHKLCGAAKYCGVPKLLHSIEQLSLAVKAKEQDRVATLAEQLVADMENVINVYQAGNFKS